MTDDTGQPTGDRLAALEAALRVVLSYAEAQPPNAFERINAVARAALNAASPLTGPVPDRAPMPGSDHLIPKDDYDPRLVAILERLAAGQWRPIKTAPKDEAVFVWVEKRQFGEPYAGIRCIGIYDPTSESWVDDNDGTRFEWEDHPEDQYRRTSRVTLWQPLPEPPRALATPGPEEKP